jgi:DNA-binding response OmpR family regulator
MTIRVLLIDDNDASRFTLCALLESEAFEVIEGTCLSDARRSLAESPAFDLVLLDRHLSDGQGPALIPTVRVQLPDCKVIVVSGSDHDDVPGESPADAYFGKGEDLDVLFAKIQSLLAPMANAASAGP